MEGFGLPPVEAMVSGTPVLSSRAGSLPEVIGPAGIYFDPFEIDQIVQAMTSLLTTPAERDRLSQLALVQAQKFTWSRSAELLLDCFATLDPIAPRRRPRSPSGSARRDVTSASRGSSTTR